jgi:hypothetical protein
LHQKVEHPALHRVEPEEHAHRDQRESDREAQHDDEDEHHHHEDSDLRIGHRSAAWLG